MEKDDGGPAFPQLAIESQERDGHGDTMEPFTSARGGMSLRDWFAGQALSGFVGIGDASVNATVAQNAYAMADAMLAARKPSP